jgi:hypothetical protein
VFRKGTGRKPSILRAIELLIETGAYPEFKATLEQSLQPLQNSVSRGRAELKKIREASTLRPKK